MDRHRLGITYIRSLTGSLVVWDSREPGRASCPGSCRKRDRSCAGVRRSQQPDFGGVESIRPFRGSAFRRSDRAIPTRPIAELTALINDLTSAETAGSFSVQLQALVLRRQRQDRASSADHPRFLLSRDLRRSATEPSPYVAMSLNKRLVTFKLTRIPADIGLQREPLFLVPNTTWIRNHRLTPKAQLIYERNKNKEGRNHDGHCCRPVGC